MNDKPLKDWSTEERIKAVKNIFSEITPHYDRMNRIMSARRDVSWRRFMVKKIPSDARLVLDVATGTGDVALDIIKYRPEIKVYGLDFVEEMLRLAINKTRAKGLTDKNIEYLVGDAMSLPFPDNHFDAVTVAFGMRNMPDRPGAVSEMKRVVKPGGKVLVLEMTFPRNLKMRKFFYWYLNNVIPILGRIITRNKAAYNYLSESIQDFIHPDKLEQMFADASLNQIKAHPLTFGIAYLHEGIKV
jgi:demethylmenaquinone methyltransferase / 2-methoxy-6-polyprenyl-1,4-benzoquinol methylase